ncbi:hypothetical protein B0T49_12165 [Chromobacterium violaceum]|uniref:hypothetical protein n=1 Tax=Chromobacterium violaceum TaxID=536 RepID=UPI0009D9E71B|nr:hypothetical protein [Chromobacterium violaceum]OQS47705.1 hypothetical protein B0T48_11450 [Chromobacterium violaceum]OQS49835.1 hypothetical protein B0T49_12165 [Chromobacterium violaceum]
MNKPIEAVLAEAEELISRNEVTKAFDSLTSLLLQCSQVDLGRLHDPITEIIGRFLPKKRRELLKLFGGRLGHDKAHASLGSSSTGSDNLAGLQTFVISLRDRFDELSEWHIFQWSTYYKDELRAITAETVELLRSSSDENAAFEQVAGAIQNHSVEIFTKGFSFVMSQSWATRDAAVVKSLGGLRSFLELPVEIYADESSRITEPKDCRTLRRVTSRMLRGILVGFLNSKLGEAEPAELLVRTAKTWVHVLPLLELDDLRALSKCLQLEDIAPLLGSPLQTLIRELDHASRMSSVDAVVVTSALINIDDQIIDITLRPPADSSDTKPLEISVLGGDGPIVRHQIEQRVKLGYIACLTFKPATWYWKGTFPTKEVKDVVVAMSDEGSNSVGFLLSRLRLRFYENTLVVQPSVPLRTNIAERFPLENPTLLTFFRVERQSIRALQTTLSTRTGVLLWCSVRRSGKTTGVSELASGIAERNAVFQRCEMTGGDMTSRMLFEEVCDALDSNASLPRDFLRSVVARAAPMGGQQKRGSILIVDEYDRLFGRLRVAGRRNEDARHLIIQPLLDQFVEFATENLLILLGQQPNAHFIFMDQNQLSAYVQQEPYPLFSHETGSLNSEFHELVRRTFQKTLPFDASFVDCIYEEAGGHPFLTINLLRDFVDWLIKKKVVPSETLLTRELFREYAIQELTLGAIGRSRHYHYFRSAASEALSRDGIEQSPWIHAAYKLLRHLSQNGEIESIAMDQDNIEEFMVSTLADAHLNSYTVNSFLASASESNFIELANGQVKARVPLLARISAAVGVAH